ncbi:Helix-turn-helix domain-containing protein [Tistlia consotensis]|uniref:Helix-turn-helix domain-containing protein n=1 Tax=Tistlia consotensis USBA 355 TaxID=560819 RepID=A0A1Y6C8K1_9PROT|nr:helix-turn-helix domain-containing protein [Tistlia consotensis]SMF41526.1 Helix-turn-helix domain-containing protein [Tistlia consotensis USBA 355]SNR73663.1 Helix-turn-helix domain-containing protein [Tistlia consotensis]
MDERTTQPLGSLPHRFREARGRLSPERAAAALGVAPSALLQIESGDREPTVGQMLGAAEAYGTELRSLLFGRPRTDPALAHLGPDLAELLQEYMRERHRAERVDQLSDAQLQDLNRVIARVSSLGGLVEDLLRRRRDGDSGAADQLSALTDALRRVEGLLDRGGIVPGTPERLAAEPAETLPDFTFEDRPPELLKARHAIFGTAIAWFERTGGRVAEDELGFQRLLPWLQIMLPTSDGFPYLHCGDRTPPAELWGEPVARSLVGRFNLPDGSLCRASARAFLEIHRSRRPLTQACRGPIVVGGVARPEAWQRFVLPLQFRGLACIATLALLGRDREPPLLG